MSSNDDTLGNTTDGFTTTSSMSDSQLHSALDATIYVDSYLSVSHCFFALVGIPLNLGVAAIIIGFERLHSQRNFTWLGIGFSNVFILLYHLAEVSAVYWPCPTTHQLCACFTGLPYSSLFLNYFFSLLERHLCVKYANWYKRNVGSCWMIPAGQVGSFALLCLATKGRHLFSSVPLRWNWSVQEFTYLSSFLLPGLILCLVSQTVIWVTSGFRNYPPFMGPRHPGQLEEDDAHSPFVDIDDERVSRLNVESARNVTTSFLVLLVFFIPVLVALVLFVGCLGGIPLRLLDEADMDCSYLGKAVFYLRELVSIPCSILSPVYFVMRSTDILGALRDRGFLA